MIHEEICTYEVCKLAKEKGFDEYEACNHIYEDDEQWHTLTTYTNAKGIDWSKDKFTVAPTQSLLQRWLREEKGVTICVDIFDDGWFFDISTFYKQDTGIYEVNIPYKSSSVSPVSIPTNSPSKMPLNTHLKIWYSYERKDLHISEH